MDSLIRNLAVLAASLSLLIVSSACAPEKEETVKIGMITSLQGSLAGYGGYLANAAVLATREINAAGGLHADGRRVELLIRDDASDPNRAVTAARELIEEDGIVAMVGPIGSGPTLQVADLTLAARIPQITCCATSPLLTERPETDRFLFRTAASDVLQAGVLAKVLDGIEGFDDNSDLAACEDPAIIYLDNDYGRPLSDAVEQALEATGQTIETYAVLEEQASYASTVDAVLATTPDCVVLILYAVEAAVILREAVDRVGMVPDGMRWIGTDGIKDNTLSELVGVEELPFTLIGTAPAPPATNPQGDAFAAAFIATFGGLNEAETNYVAPGIFSDNQYDAVAMLLLAIEMAGSSDGPAIRDALNNIRAVPGSNRSLVNPVALADGLAQIRAGEQIDYIGASGDVDFDARGDVYGPFEIWRYDSVNETFETLTTFAANELLPEDSQ